jgi:predicted  nucleic acid-binding Zn-ribbon protein
MSSDYSLLEEYQKELASKKTKLSQKLVDDLAEILAEIEDAGMYGYLIEKDDIFGSTLKQAICEWLRTHAEVKNHRERIEYLRFLRKRSKERDYLRCLATLCLFRHGVLDKTHSIPILSDWLVSVNSGRQVSKMLSLVFDSLGIDEAIDFLVSLGGSLQRIHPENREEIKKKLSGMLRGLTGTPEINAGTKDRLNALRQLMASESWVKSVKDEMISLNLDGVLGKTASQGGPDQSIVSGADKTASPPPVKDSEEKVPSLEVNPPERTGQAVSGTIVRDHCSEPEGRVSASYGSPTVASGGMKEVFTLPKEIGGNANRRVEEQAQSSGKGIRDSLQTLGLDREQEQLIETISKLFRRANLERRRRLEEAEKLSARCKVLEQEKATIEKRILEYQEENMNLEKKNDRLRDRLDEENARFTREREGWASTRDNLEGRIKGLSSELMELKSKCERLQEEKDRIDTLSHSTLQDSKHRSNAAVQERMSSLSSTIGLIFREVEDFERIADSLPDRARMLLNIIGKLKAALKMNGVAI